ncbi:NADH dehydrogenase i chain e [Luminiphilus syltensis NOR5-1B]|uniref:NADH-quinone oxidoreductase subunit E n=2 Tax=Luminiphilus TaxID=1341118 RepID=B8KTH7_9GAMM|nr:NADH dehydrogenase i chain e [Luminiphilus syltensis NOR5-1B]
MALRMTELIPALSDSEIAAIDAEIAHVPYRSAVAIDALKIVQAHRGWVSDESLRAIARHLEMSAEELDGVATFYNLIFRQPVGDRVILLCNSVTCWIKGCDKVQAAITENLGIGLGETTADNAFTLLPVTCLGACDRAPVMMVGDDLHQDLDPAEIEKALSGEPNRD